MRKKKKKYPIVVALVLLCAAVGALAYLFANGLPPENPLEAILSPTPEAEKPTNPDELVIRYFESISTGDYGAIYDVLSVDSKAKISREDFIAKHENIYGGIDAANIEVTVKGVAEQDGGATIVSYDVCMDTAAGVVSHGNLLTFFKDEESGKYALYWEPSAIFPGLDWTDKVCVNTLTAKRGSIYDRNGEMLAGEGYAASIGFVPGRMRGGSLRQDEYSESEPTPSPEELSAAIDEDIALIADLLEMSVESVKNKLSAKWVKDDSFVPLRTVSKDATEIQDAVLQIKGVKVADVKLRYYPLGAKASHLTGYIQNVSAEDLETLGGDGYHMNSVLGKAGLERIYEDTLRARDGAEILIVDEDGKTKQIIARIEKSDGQDLHLTIDAGIQSALYDQFAKDKSCSVAINPKTGEVLALVSTPSYDANDFVMGMSMSKWTALNEDENKPMYNRFKAAQCPGSTMKSITAAIGVNTGKISPFDDFGVSGRRWQKDGSWGGYFVTTIKQYTEPANIENALAYSDNIYYAKAALKIGGDTFAAELKRIGFENKIPFEYALYSSIISATENFTSEVQLADSGFGQGQILVNPVHLAVIYASFVNGGDILRPQLIGRGFARDVWIKNAFTPETASTVKNALVQVVERGTATEVRMPGVTLAGKTGTAEIKQSQEDTEGTELGWFVMFTADDDAKNPLLAVTMVEDVKNRGGSHYVIPKIKTLFE